ncbi:MAG: Gfo/Idh/MocA family protein [bacterium]
MGNKIWLIGAGEMAREYIKVLQGLNKEYKVIGRGEENARKIEKICGCKVEQGGLEKFLNQKPEPCTHAIVSVGMENLYEVTKQLLIYGIKNILVEKPGAMNSWQFEELKRLTEEKTANVFIAYNRRFFASVLKAQEIIKEDNGVTSFHFEFTEWSHIITFLKKGIDVKERWFLGNSTHVVDLAFFLGGKPLKISTFTHGRLDWHPSASIFSGAGLSENGALFSYHANWESAGRWGIELLTRNHRLILRPLEKLQIQKKGTIEQKYYEGIDYSFDEKYKPGLYFQTKKFIENKYQGFCTIQEQSSMIKIYCEMANYDF